jgi:outer membrane protein assembly factor BamA
MSIRFSLFILILSSALGCMAQTNSSIATQCGQEDKVRGPLADEAENGKFHVRRVEISGNSTTRHREFVKRLEDMNEGSAFSTQALEKAVRRIAKMKQIYRITMRDIELRLDRASRDVDILICVKERIRK